MRDEAHAALDRLLEAVERALSEGSHEAQKAARAEVRRLWINLTEVIDQNGVLSEFYRESADPNEQTESDWAMEVAARVLGDLSGALRGVVTNALAAVAEDIINRQQGRSTTGLLEPKKRGRGNRKRPNIVDAAWINFVHLVHYKSGRDNLIVEDSFGSLRALIGWRAFQVNQRCIPEDARKADRELGKAVRKGAPLTKEERAQSDEYEAILTDPEKLKKFVNAIAGKFDPRA
jgi:hypothetical protein